MLKQDALDKINLAGDFGPDWLREKTSIRPKQVQVYKFQDMTYYLTESRYNQILPMTPIKASDRSTLDRRIVKAKRLGRGKETPPRTPQKKTPQQTPLQQTRSRVPPPPPKQRRRTIKCSKTNSFWMKKAESEGAVEIRVKKTKEVKKRKEVAPQESAKEERKFQQYRAGRPGYRSTPHHCGPARQLVLPHDGGRPHVKTQKSTVPKQVVPDIKDPTRDLEAEWPCLPSTLPHRAHDGGRIHVSKPKNTGKMQKKSSNALRTSITKHIGNYTPYAYRASEVSNSMNTTTPSAAWFRLTDSQHWEFDWPTKRKRSRRPSKEGLFHQTVTNTATTSAARFRPMERVRSRVTFTVKRVMNRLRSNMQPDIPRLENMTGGIPQ